MRRSVAEMIVRDPEKYAHHDRVFLNNPVVMQAWAWPRWWCLPPRAKTPDAGGSVALLLTVPPDAGLPC